MGYFRTVISYHAVNLQTDTEKSIITYKQKLQINKQLLQAFNKVQMNAFGI